MSNTVNVRNTTKGVITASSGHAFPAGKTTTVKASTWQGIAQEPFIAGQLKRGNLTVGETAKAAKDAAES